MRVSLAHLLIQGQSCAIFDADARDGTNASRSALLARLTSAARSAGLAFDRRVLAFRRFGRLTFFGDDDLAHILAAGHPIRWTHHLDLH